MLMQNTEQGFGFKEGVNASPHAHADAEGEASDAEGEASRGDSLAMELELTPQIIVITMNGLDDLDSDGESVAEEPPKDLQAFLWGVWSKAGLEAYYNIYIYIYICK